jgi:GAF domain-containing protein
MDICEGCSLRMIDFLESSQDSDVVLSQLMPRLGDFLQCDRCFLYLRDPATRLGRVPFCWTRTPDIPTVYDEEWKPEPENLPNEDPMFAAALRTEPSIFVEDVETASPQVLNRQFEQENFGHRALIHAHLCHNGQLWGVLQPSVFDRPRVWNPEERAAIAQLLPKLTPIAIAYIKAAQS